MKRNLIATALFLLGTGAAFAQIDSMTLDERMTNLNMIMDKQEPMLDNIYQKLQNNKTEITERVIVLVYHAGNPEVKDSVKGALKRIRNSNDVFNDTLRSFKVQWFAQSSNLAAVFTAYGMDRKPVKAKEGYDPTKYDALVARYNRFLRTMAKIEADIELVWDEADYLESQNR